MKKLSDETIQLAVEAYGNGIKEAHKTIEVLTKEIQKLQDQCSHNQMKPRERAWAPGHLISGQVCEICDYWEADKMDYEPVITSTNVPEGETFNIDMSKKENDI